jgi:hypothetical protein
MRKEIREVLCDYAETYHSILLGNITSTTYRATDEAERKIIAIVKLALKKHINNTMKEGK